MHRTLHITKRIIIDDISKIVRLLGGYKTTLDISTQSINHQPKTYNKVEAVNKLVQNHYSQCSIQQTRINNLLILLFECIDGTSSLDWSDIMHISYMLTATPDTPEHYLTSLYLDIYPSK